MLQMINFLQTIVFSDEEIKEVEKTFFPLGTTFNSEQRNVIGCFSKQNIQACPGSGKTTTLAAKLLLLRKKLPKNIKGGICILTHTNVAVDIIKQRLGAENAAFYTNYPNYLGTIQSFINKFLAIPAYRDIFKKPLQAIDDEIFYSIIEKRQRQASTAAIFLSRSKGIDSLGELSFNIHNFDISKLNTDMDPIVGKHTQSYLQLYKLKKRF